MDSENASQHCPECGVTLRTDAPAGLCPRCLMGKAMQPTALEGEPDVAGADTPSLAEVREAFPELEVLSLIGRGGMGAVFRARQPKLNRDVALKILPRSLGVDASFAERFQREAQALAALNHPNIVTIHDFGDQRGFYYLLMEFVDGMNLRELLRNRRLSPEEALAIVPPLCEALQSAHEHGIVHRDIKPENLLLDKAGQVKIADFGIMRMVDANQALESESKAAGTPGYMAPEQLHSPDKVDNRADIYSLGVVIYEMLTGEKPSATLVPPSSKVAIDVRLDDIVLRALSNEPERRYQTASDLRTQVEQTLASVTPSKTRDEEPPPLPQTSPPLLKRPTVWLLIVTLLFPAILFFILVLPTQKERMHRARALSERASLVEQKKLVESRMAELEAQGDGEGVQALQGRHTQLAEDIAHLSWAWEGTRMLGPFQLDGWALVLAFAGIGVFVTVRGWQWLFRLRRQPPPRHGVAIAMVAAWFFPLLFANGLLMSLLLYSKAKAQPGVQVAGLSFGGLILLVGVLVANIWVVRRTWVWVNPVERKPLPLRAILGWLLIVGSVGSLGLSIVREQSKAKSLYAQDFKNLTQLQQQWHLANNRAFEVETKIGNLEVTHVNTTDPDALSEVERERDALQRQLDFENNKIRSLEKRMKGAKTGDSAWEALRHLGRPVLISVGLGVLGFALLGTTPRCGKRRRVLAAVLFVLLLIVTAALAAYEMASHQKNSASESMKVSVRGLDLRGDAVSFGYSVDTVAPGWQLWMQAEHWQGSEQRGKTTRLLPASGQIEVPHDLGEPTWIEISGRVDNDVTLVPGERTFVIDAKAINGERFVVMLEMKPRVIPGPAAYQVYLRQNDWYRSMGYGEVRYDILSSLGGYDLLVEADGANVRELEQNGLEMVALPGDLAANQRLLTGRGSGHFECHYDDKEDSVPRVQATALRMITIEPGKEVTLVELFNGVSVRLKLRKRHDGE